MRGKGEQWGVRSLLINLFTSVLKCEDAHIVAWITGANRLLQDIFRDLPHDREPVLRNLLDTLASTARRTDLYRRAKLSLFTASNILSLAALYEYDPDATVQPAYKRRKAADGSAGRSWEAADSGGAAAQDSDDGGSGDDGNNSDSGGGSSAGSVTPRAEGDEEEDPDVLAASGMAALDDAEAPTETVPEQVHQLLLFVCCDPAAGVCHSPSSGASSFGPQAALFSGPGAGNSEARAAAVAWRQGWDREEIRNRSLLHVLRRISRVAHDSLRRALVLAIVKASPDIFPHFMDVLASGHEAPGTFRWLSSMQLAYQAAMLPPPSLYAQGVTACLEHRIESAVPHVFERRNSSKGFLMEDRPLVTLTCSKGVLACLRRTEAVLLMVREEVRLNPDLAGPWLEFEDAFLNGVAKRLPDVQGIVAALPRAASWPLLHALLLQIVEGYQTHLPSTMLGFNLERLLPPPAVHSKLHPAVRSATYAALSKARGLQWSSQPSLLGGGREDDTKAKAKAKAKAKKAVSGGAEEEEEDAAAAAAVAETRFGVLLHTAAFTMHHVERRALQRLAMAALDDTGAFTGDLAHELAAWIAHLPAHLGVIRFLEELYVHLSKNPWRLASSAAEGEEEKAGTAPVSPMLQRALACWKGEGAASDALAQAGTDDLGVLTLYLSHVVADVEAAAVADRGQALAFSRLANVWGAPRAQSVASLRHLSFAAMRLANILCGNMAEMDALPTEAGSAADDAAMVDTALARFESRAAALKASRGALVLPAGATEAANAIVALNCALALPTALASPGAAEALQRLLALAQEYSSFAVSASTTLFFLGLKVRSLGARGTFDQAGARRRPWPPFVVLVGSISKFFTAYPAPSHPIPSPLLLLSHPRPRSPRPPSCCKPWPRRRSAATPPLCCRPSPPSFTFLA